MRAYELVVILKDSLTEEKRKKVLTTLKGMLKDAKITKEDAWGVKPFSYPIKHERSGYYEVMHFETDVAIPSDFEKKVQTNENIIRHLLVRTK